MAKSKLSSSDAYQPQTPPSVPDVFVGDMVLFGVEGRPAIVVRVPDNINGLVNLQVFYDNGADGVNHSPVWKSMIGYSKEPAPHTWRFLD